MIRKVRETLKFSSMTANKSFGREYRLLHLLDFKLVMKKTIPALENACFLKVLISNSAYYKTLTLYFTLLKDNYL